MKAKTKKTRKRNLLMKPVDTTLDNFKAALGTRDNYRDLGAAALGGFMYVTLTTLIQRAGVQVNPATATAPASYTVRLWDINGWPTWWIGVVGNLLIGAALRSPGYMSGALGTGIAHIMYTKLNEPVIKRFTGIYAARLDASSTSTMGDDAQLKAAPEAKQLQPGARQAMVNGVPVVLYARPQATETRTEKVGDNHQVSLNDNHKMSLSDNGHAASVEVIEEKKATQNADNWHTGPLAVYI